MSSGLRYMAAGAFFFSVMSLLVKSAGQRLPIQQVVLARALVTLSLSAWAARAAGLALGGHNRRLLLVRGVVGFTALSAFYYALIHLPLAEATVIQYVNPVFAALLAVPFLGEELRPRDIAALLASLAGVVLMAQPAVLFGGASALSPFAVGVGLAGALFSGAAYVSVRRLRTTDAPMVIIFWFSLVTVVLSAPVAIPALVWPTPTEWLALLGIGLTAQLGQIAITRGLHRERAGRATTVGYLQIVFAAVWGALFFAEYPDLGTFVGAALIVASTASLARSRNGTVPAEESR